MDKKIDNFIRKIYPIYVMLRWTWASAQKKNSFIPTEQELKSELLRLIDDLRKSPKSYRISTGGLFAEREEGNIISFGFSMHEYF